MTERHTFTIDLKPADDVPGQWVAHCTEVDVVTQGNSRDHALVMAFEAMTIVAQADLLAGRSVLDRKTAPAAGGTESV